MTARTKRNDEVLTLIQHYLPLNNTEEEIVAMERAIRRLVAKESRRAFFAGYWSMEEGDGADVKAWTAYQRERRK